MYNLLLDKMEPERYDRQLRLWGSHGQRKLSRASLCCFGSSAVACEILKNLILPGIGSFVIVDETRLTDRDFGQNFFVPPIASVGEFRGRVVLETLLQLNPTVKGSFAQDVSELDEKFDVCIVANFGGADGVEKILHSSIYVIIANSIGFIGRVNCVFNRPHVILEAKSEEGRIEDFRLTNPWPELRSFSDQIFQNEDIYHVPFFVILVRAAAIASSLTKAGLTEAIKSLAPPGMYEELENFQQAVANTYRITALVGDAEIVSELKSILTIEKVDKQFAHVVGKVVEFYEKHQCLPLCGSSLPDMASSSEMYAKLCTIYKEKALRDLELISDVEDMELVKLVVANIRNVRVLTKTAEDELLEDEQREIIEFFETGKFGPLLGEEIERYDSELHSVSSVIGAVAAQEIVKLLTNQFTPIAGTFVFNGINGTAFGTG